MKTRYALLIVSLCTALLISPLSHASETIVKKARCVACHMVDQKRVGPAYKDVAAKYKGEGSKAAERLFAKVRAGGSGVWGEIPMTPNGADKISDDDLMVAIKWILTLG